MNSMIRRLSLRSLNSTLLRNIAQVYGIKPVPEFPPVLEDIAVIVDKSVPPGA